MIATCIIACLAILLTFLCLLLFPVITIKGHQFSTFYFPSLIALIVLLASGLLPIQDYLSNLVKDTTMNPLEILALFFGTAFISTVLDELGFFSFLASLAVKRAKNSQFALFIILYFLCAFLTMFTSNDIVIISFTPFILFFAKDAKINPIPFLFCEFVAANTWSMMFIFGNPTNVYLSSFFALNFVSYFVRMWFPTLLAGLFSLGLLLLLFHKNLKEKMNVQMTEEKIQNPFILYSALGILLLVTVFMAISGFFHIPMWIFALVGAVLLMLLILAYSLFSKEKPLLLWKAGKRLPFSLAPFLLSMFGIVMALSKEGVSAEIGNFLSQFNPMWSYGVSSFFLANLMNNLPMSIFYADLLSFLPSSESALFATIISSNLGAILTPIGALAGIMWMRILKEHDLKFSFGKFTLYGLVVSIPTLLVAFAGLLLEFTLFPSLVGFPAVYLPHL